MNFSANNTCDIPLPISTARFVIIVILGTPLSLVGVLTNSFILWYFARPAQRSTPTLYLAVLAFLDISICTCYLLIMSVDAVSIYWNLETLWIVWHYYLVPVFTLSRISQLASSYVIVCASLERWILVSPCETVNKLKFLTTNSSRHKILIVLFASAVSLRLITVWEYVIISKEHCTAPMTWLSIDTPLAAEPMFQVFDLYILPSFQVFMPFVALLLLNTLTVNQIRKQQETQEVQRKSVAMQVMSSTTEDVNGEEKEVLSVALDLIGYMFEVRNKQTRERIHEKLRLRGATLTLTALVSTYLICNSYSLFIKILEQVLPDHDSLIWNEPYWPTDFYTISSDVISFMFMFNSFIRLFIYYLCNMEIKKGYMEPTNGDGEFTSDTNLLTPPFPS